MKKTKTSEFTLIERIFIAMIIVVMVALLIPAGFIISEKHKREACKQNLRQVRIGLAMYAGNMGTPDNVLPGSNGEGFPVPNGRKGLQMLADTGFLEETLAYTCPSTDDFVEDYTKVFSNSSYAYAGGLDVGSHPKMAIVSDRANNHNKYGKNINLYNSYLGLCNLGLSALNTKKKDSARNYSAVKKT